MWPSLFFGVFNLKKPMQGFLSIICSGNPFAFQWCFFYRYQYSRPFILHQVRPIAKQFLCGTFWTTVTCTTAITHTHTQRSTIVIPIIFCLHLILSYLMSLWKIPHSFFWPQILPTATLFPANALFIRCRPKRRSGSSSALQASRTPSRRLPGLWPHQQSVAHEKERWSPWWP